MSEQPCSSAHVFLSFSSSTPRLSHSPFCSLSPLQCRMSHPYVLSLSLSMHQVVLLVISTAVQMKRKHQAFGDFNSNSRWVLQRSGELGFCGGGDRFQQLLFWDFGSCSHGDFSDHGVNTQVRKLQSLAPWH